MTPTLAVYIFITVACAFVVKGLAGFGDPLISNPLLAMKLNNKDISPSLLPISLGLNAYIVFKNRKNFSFQIVSSITLWVLIGIIPGTMLLKLGAPWIIKVILGILIIGLGVEMLTRDNAKQFQPNPVVKAVMCFLSGVTAGLFGINLLFLIYMERSSTDRSAFRANTCFVFLIENAFRTVMYIINGIFTVFTLQITAVTVPAAALGSFLCGRTAGKQRRRGGLKTGAVCGVLYCVPLILAALIFGTVQGILLPVKAALCIGFAAAGGGSGVNSPEK